MARLILIEDDITLAESVQKNLVERNFVVDVVHDGEEGLRWLTEQTYDAAILDWMLPLLNGPLVCQRHRQEGGNTPIILLTARGQLKDKLEAFDCGADDYLVKPFEIDELLARIASLLRRPRTIRLPELQVGPFRINTQLSVVTFNGNKIELRRREYQILELLVQNRGQVFNAERIIERLWPTDVDSNPEVVRCHINRLRQKLSTRVPDATGIIETVYGMGYRVPEQF